MLTNTNITHRLGDNLKVKAQNYNKVLITLNQDILDRFVLDSDGTIFKIIDFKPGEFIVKIQMLFDNNKILLNWKKFQNVQNVPMLDFI